MQPSTRSLDPEAPAGSDARGPLGSPKRAATGSARARTLAGPLVAAAVVVAWVVARVIGSADADADGAGAVAGPELSDWLGLGFGLALALAVHLLVHATWSERQLRRRVAVLQAAAETDTLTGLTTRAGIAGEVERRLGDRSRGGLVGVLFCDLDRLEVVNDSLGHAAGDQVLAVAARRLGGVLREDDLIGRFGGDEFVVVSSGLPTLRDLEILAERLIEALRRPVGLADGSAQVVSGSVGIAYATDGPAQGEPPDGEATPAPPPSGEITAADLLRDAEVAMHRAKREGGDRLVVFDESHRAQAVARLELEQELRRGIRDGQIELHYQPIVNRRTGEIDCYEALIRWEHPTRGTVHPSEFLPVAAESLLIVELGDLVLEEACRQAVQWSAHLGRPISVAVNVAERQLLGAGLVDSVTRALARTGLPAEQLELEITEELILERLDHSLVVLRQLDLLGVALAIDDFGTSQASLSRLKQLAMVSTLKIDRLFVADIAVDEVDRKIVAAIVALASSVGLSVVAEGVEDEAQAAVLGELGVERLQGFLYGRPGPAGATPASWGLDTSTVVDAANRSARR